MVGKGGGSIGIGVGGQGSNSGSAHNAAAHVATPSETADVEPRATTWRGSRRPISSHTTRLTESLTRSTGEVVPAARGPAASASANCFPVAMYTVAADANVSAETRRRRGVAVATRHAGDRRDTRHRGLDGGGDGAWATEDDNLRWVQGHETACGGVRKRYRPREEHWGPHVARCRGSGEGVREVGT